MRSCGPQVFIRAIREIRGEESFRGMRTDQRSPNQSLQTTPRLRLGWHVGRHWRGVSELYRSVSFDAPGGFPEMHSGESDAPFRVGALVDADIWCHGLVSALGFQSRGEWNQDGTDWSIGWPDQFAADDHRGFGFRED